MKKLIGVLLAVVLCVCMTMPVAFASAEDALTDGIMGAISGVLTGETSSEDALGLGSFDIGGIIGSFIEEEEANEQVDPQVQIEQALQNAQDTVASKLPGAGAIDFSWLTSTLSEGVDVAAVESAVSEISADEMPDLLTVIAEAFGGAGIDMTSFDVSALGKFDIATLLGGAAEDDSKVTGTATDVAPEDSSMITTDLMTGILDTLKGGLTTVGIDADTLLGSLGDNELINFFANMYIGFCGPVATDEEITGETTTEECPDTGDTASALFAVVTLTVATAAAGVCLKKKED